jgi:hypothetical protein
MEALPCPEHGAIRLFDVVIQCGQVTHLAARAGLHFAIQVEFHVRERAGGEPIGFAV